MKVNKKRIKKLFPNKNLTVYESEWVMRYINFFPFDPIWTEDVVDEKTFYEMTQRNIQWLDDFANEGTKLLERATRELPFYKLING